MFIPEFRRLTMGTQRGRWWDAGLWLPSDLCPRWGDGPCLHSEWGSFPKERVKAVCGEAGGGRGGEEETGSQEAQLTQDPWVQSREEPFSGVHFIGCCVCPGSLHPRPGQCCITI